MQHEVGVLLGLLAIYSKEQMISMNCFKNTIIANNRN
mgnify:CR=1 FL=1